MKLPERRIELFDNFGNLYEVTHFEIVQPEQYLYPTFGGAKAPPIIVRTEVKIRDVVAVSPNRPKSNDHWINLHCQRVNLPNL